MRVTIRIVDHRLSLDALFCRGQRDVNETASVRRGCAGGNFERVEALARVAIAHLGQMRGSFVVNAQAQLAESAFFVRQRFPYQGEQIFDRKRFELEDLRARHERAIDIEKRVVCGRAD